MTRMRRVGFSAVLLFIGCSVMRPAPSDDGSIRSLIAQYVEARNEKAVARVRNLFTADADQLVSNGEWRHGVDELVRGMTSSSNQEQAKSSISVKDVRMIDSGAAIVDGRYQTVSLDGTVRDMWTTFVVKRTSQGWRIAAIRNMKPAASHQVK